MINLKNIFIKNKKYVPIINKRNVSSLISFIRTVYMSGFETIVRIINSRKLQPILMIREEVSFSHTLVGLWFVNTLM